jgi:hypothetical protein
MTAASTLQRLEFLSSALILNLAFRPLHDWLASWLESVPKALQKN